MSPFETSTLNNGMRFVGFIVSVGLMQFHNSLAPVG
jgi:hypothetical protein